MNVGPWGMVPKMFAAFSLYLQSIIKVKYLAGKHEGNTTLSNVLA